MSICSAYATLENMAFEKFAKIEFRDSHLADWNMSPIFFATRDMKTGEIYSRYFALKCWYSSVLLVLGRRFVDPLY